MAKSGLRIVGIALTVLVALASSAASQFPVHGDFDTPEEELEAVLRALDPTTEDEMLRRLVTLIAPSAIIPEVPPTDGAEWLHFWGGRVTSGAADFAWGTVTWTVIGDPVLRIEAHLDVPDRDLTGTLIVSRAESAGLIIGATLELQLEGNWAAETFPPNILRVSSRLVINPAEFRHVSVTGGVRVYSLDAAAFLSADAFGLSRRYRDGRTLTLSFAFGETGRAVFDQAFAAWGLAPAAGE